MRNDLLGRKRCTIRKHLSSFQRTLNWSPRDPQGCPAMPGMRSVVDAISSLRVVLFPLRLAIANGLFIEQLYKWNVVLVDEIIWRLLQIRILLASKLFWRRTPVMVQTAVLASRGICIAVWQLECGRFVVEFQLMWMMQAAFMKYQPFFTCPNSWQISHHLHKSLIMCLCM